MSKRDDGLSIDKALYDGLQRIEDKLDKQSERLSNVERKQAVAEERQKTHADHMEVAAENIKQIHKILVKQHESLDTHIRRTDLLQDGQEDMKKALQELHARITPLEHQKTMADVIREYENEKSKKFWNKMTDWKVLTAIGASLVSIAAGLGKILGWW